MEEQLQGQEAQTTDLESQGTESAPALGGNEAPTKQDIVDLGSLEKFKFNGQEWTLKDLQSGFMRQSDYTRKTMELAETRKSFEEERKYVDNLQADLDAVAKNPELAWKFKETYPEKYHNYLRYVLKEAQAQQAQNPNNPQGIPHEIMDRFLKVEHTLKEREIAAAQAELDATFSKLKTKYPFADEDTILAKAQILAERKQKLDEGVFDKLFKAENDRLEAIAKKYYSEQVKTQKTMNAKGRDIAKGGGTPSEAPRKFKTIKEATEAALNDLESFNA